MVCFWSWELNRIKAGKWVVNNEMGILGSKSGAFLSSIIPYKVSVNMKRKVNGCNGRQYFINITVKDVEAVPSLSPPIETAILDTMRNVYSDTKKKSAEIVANKKKRIREVVQPSPSQPAKEIHFERRNMLLSNGLGTFCQFGHFVERASEQSTRQC